MTIGDKRVEKNSLKDVVGTHAGEKEKRAGALSDPARRSFRPFLIVHDNKM